MSRPKNHLLVLPLLAALTGCGAIKQPEGTPVTQSLAPSREGVIADTSRKIVRGGDESAFMLLKDGKSALDWRLAFCDHAIDSIDAQYFIWDADESGHLLISRMLDAADRGVRVRLMLDDFPLATEDKTLAALCQHQNVEVRLYNANAMRGKLGFGLNLLGNFRELNRRMHNKIMVVDNRMAIVGGRNISNHYFGLGKTYNFRDLDVLTAGPVVPGISASFDRFWNSEKSVPGSVLAKGATLEEAHEAHELARAYIVEHAETLSSYPLQRKNWSGLMRHFAANAHYGEAQYVQDEPVEIKGEDVRLVDMIDYLSAPSQEEVLIVSAYLIPVRGFLEDCRRLEENGVEVEILTSGLEATDNKFVNSHYRKYRRRILRTGAELNEARGWPDHEQRANADVHPVAGEFVSIHMKAIVGDRERCFIGSLNLDPRAVVINTEGGLVIESRGLAEELGALVDSMNEPDNAWEVSIEGRNRLKWENSDKTQYIQPARNFRQRIRDVFLRMLPVESQL